MSRFKPFQFHAPSLGWFVCISEPSHVQHILETNFKNYEKVVSRRGMHAT